MDCDPDTFNSRLTRVLADSADCDNAVSIGRLRHLEQMGKKLLQQKRARAQKKLAAKQHKLRHKGSVGIEWVRRQNQEMRRDKLKKKYGKDYQQERLVAAAMLSETQH